MTHSTDPRPEVARIDAAQLSAANLAFLETQLLAWRHDPDSVEPGLRALFDDVEAANGAGPQIGPAFRPSSLFRPASLASAPPARATGATLVPRRATDAQVQQRVPLLRRSTLFQDLDEAQLEVIACAVSEVRVQEGDKLFSAGDPGDGVYVITEGRIRVAHGGLVIADLEPGEVVGELAIMDHQPRSADGVALTDAVLVRLSTVDLDRLLEQHSEIARGLFRVVAQRLRDANVRQESVDRLIRGYRVRGHVAAQLDPLGRVPDSHPELSLAYYGLSEKDLDLPFSSLSLHVPGVTQMTLRRILQRLQNTYCRGIGAQFMHIDDLRVQRWLTKRMESSENRVPLTPQSQRRIYTKLAEAELFEQFVHKKYLGAKRFSLEGGESLIPLLDMAIEEAAEHDVREVVIAMAHRGRLNVLANIMGKSPQQIFEEFEDADPEAKLGRGDVKYHLGFSNRRETQAGSTMGLSLCFNPSHLEFVNPVALGRVRAKQDRSGDRERKRVMGLVIHGDAAFIGQGVVAETLNMSELDGYKTGGTIHVIVNNQIGFTTPPESSRSSRYASDVARMLQIPIFHVNGEDPEAVAQVITLALQFRAEFARDVVIDMYCYRKYGHNEGDEPSFTQPLMYKHIRKRASVRESYRTNLLRLGGMNAAEAQDIEEQCKARLEAYFDAAKESSHDRAKTRSKHGVWGRYVGGLDRAVPEVDTAVSLERLQRLLRAQTTVPNGFKLHSKLKRFHANRLEMAHGERALDWGAGESLAFASLLAEGHPIRLSGQDSGRGTFSHRHSVWHDGQTGEVHIPLNHVAEDQAHFEVIDSPLSETGVLGFDYGYSLDSPDALVIWEAQFGDFANGAQVIIDQFITSGEDKWGRMSGLVMLLPHGFEGQGPEHSSARLERFLTLAADDNIAVMNLTTPAQLFHGLRRHVRRSIRKPLVVMTPKSLLRHPRAVSPIAELAEGRFRKVIADDGGPAPETTRRVLLCSGKVYYDLLAYREEHGIDDIGIVRLEQFYPIPDAELEAVLNTYGEDVEVWWVQEEPVNMGAWAFLRLRLGHRIFGRNRLRGVSRPESSSPATGSAASHKMEQQRLLEMAFSQTSSVNV